MWPFSSSRRASQAAGDVDEVVDQKKLEEALKLQRAEYKQLYTGLGLFLTNHFNDAEAHFSKFAEREDLSLTVRSAHLVLFAFVNFFKAISTWGKEAIDQALVLIWKAEAMARGEDNKDRLGARLVQANAYLLGALMQLLQRRVAKAAWNIRTSWTHFSAALKVLSDFKGSPDLKAEHECTAKLGVGAFNLILSFLPPTIVFVAKILGFSADRIEGLRLLREAASADRLFSPIAGQIIVMYLGTLSAMTAEQTPAMVKECGEMVGALLKKYPDGVLFLLAQGRYYRSSAQLEKAEAVAQRVEQVCTDVPAFSLLGSWQAGWVTMLNMKWSKMRENFGRIAESTGSLQATKDGCPVLYHFLSGVGALLEGDEKKGRALILAAPGKMLRKELNLEVYAKRRAEEFAKKFPAEAEGSKLESDKVRAWAALRATEITIVWNSVYHIPKVKREAWKRMLDGYYERRKELGWGDYEYAWRAIFNALCLRADGKVNAALKAALAAVAQSKAAGKDGKKDCQVSLAYYHLTLCLLRVSPPDLKRAGRKLDRAMQNASGGDWTRRISFLVHSLRARVKREQKGGASAKSEAKAEGGGGGGVIGAFSSVGGAVGSVASWGWSKLAGGGADEESDDDAEAIAALNEQREKGDAKAAPSTEKEA